MAILPTFAHFASLKLTLLDFLTRMRPQKRDFIVPLSRNLSNAVEINAPRSVFDEIDLSFVPCMRLCDSHWLKDPMYVKLDRQAASSGVKLWWQRSCSSYGFFLIEKSIGTLKSIHLNSCMQRIFLVIRSYFRALLKSLLLPQVFGIPVIRRQRAIFLPNVGSRGLMNSLRNRTRTLPLHYKSSFHSGHEYL